jgi:uncharacterized protein (DUF2249 family)
MKISVNTKISALFKQNPASLDAIVAINSKFEKLKNPILRKLMAGRTSIAQAAKIGNVPIKDFFKALVPLGFETDEREPAVAENNATSDRPAFLQHITPGRIQELDVRPVLERGDDPLQLIMKAIHTLPTDHALKLINSFEPTPLVVLLKKKGYGYWHEWISEKTIHCYFYFAGKPGSKETTAKTALTSPNNWNDVLAGFNERIKQIDVRALEMPQPMLTILEELKNLAAGYVLYVYHKRVPVYLIDELKSKQYDYRFKEIHPGEVHLLIWKKM